MLIINKKLFIVKHISFITSANTYAKSGGICRRFLIFGLFIARDINKKTTFSQDRSLLQTERC